MLPPAYLDRIRDQLGPAEAEAYVRSLDGPRVHGLRVNPLKVGEGDPLFAELRRLFDLVPVPWCRDGYRYPDAVRPGRHPYHAAGLYYIQEPSAMISAELLDPRPGELVLDLAAAPGGKTAQIAARMAGRGLLVANEIHPARARILSENVERLGIAGALVTNASPPELAARFPETFDRIMLDAPCSGEGMFRKDPDAVREWSPEHVRACAARQRAILDDAAGMLKPGGRLVYSTCTLNREENEETVAAFLERHPAFALLREERIWPHRDEGEGHYAAVLEKRDEEPSSGGGGRRSGRGGSAKGSKDAAAAGAALEQFRAFAEAWLPGFSLPDAGRPLLFGEALYWLPQPRAGWPDERALAGLRAPRPGLHLGDVRKGRFEPGHALAMAARSADAACVDDREPDAPETAAYLRGESLPGAPGRSGWGLFAVSGQPLGWFKASDGQHKNRRPKGLRSFS